MGIEENKKTLQRNIDEMMNNGDYSKANEIMHEDYVSPRGGGIEESKQHRDFLWTSVPDAHIEILDMIAEEDKIAVWQKVKGTFTGGLYGLKGKGQSFDRVYASIYEFKDGKIIRSSNREVIDTLSFFQQLGVLPSTEEIVKAYNDSLK